MRSRSSRGRGKFTRGVRPSSVMVGLVGLVIFFGGRSAVDVGRS
jgi:hypothetical protein